MDESGIFIVRKINGQETQITLTEEELDAIFEVLKESETFDRLEYYLNRYLEEVDAVSLMATQTTNQPYFEALFNFFEEYERASLDFCAEANLKAALFDASPLLEIGEEDDDILPESEL